MTLKHVLDTVPQGTPDHPKVQQRMQFCSEEIVDVDRHQLYFASKEDLTCHVSHHQESQQTFLTIRQLNICSLDSAGPLVGRLVQQLEPRTSSDQCSASCCPGQVSSLCHLISAITEPAYRAASGLFLNSDGSGKRFPSSFWVFVPALCLHLRGAGHLRCGDPLSRLPEARIINSSTPSPSWGRHLCPQAAPRCGTRMWLFSFLVIVRIFFVDFSMMVT